MKDNAFLVDFLSTAYFTPVLSYPRPLIEDQWHVSLVTMRIKPLVGGPVLDPEISLLPDALTKNRAEAALSGRHCKFT